MTQAIETLLARYYQGETTLDEERQLRRYFQQESVPDHLQGHAAQFRHFATAQRQEPSAEFKDRLAAKLTAPPPAQIRRLLTWGARWAASVTLLLLGFVGGMLYDQFRSALTGRSAAPAAEMKRVLSFAQQPHTSASERIQAINQSYALTDPDQDLTQLLINTLNFDANVNVRQTAAQALGRFDQEPGVREALIQSLSVQTDPNLQITLIELLVAIKEKRAVQAMQRLARQPQLLDAVRQKAQEGIHRLGASQPSAS